MAWSRFTVCGALLCLAAAAQLEAQDAGRWQALFDGRVFAQYTRSGTERGAQAFASSNWFTFELSRSTEKERFVAAAMSSLEPITVGKCGYPRLLTPGFLCFENVLEDRQHPHPLIMTVAASYERILAERTHALLLAGVAGSPAFCPKPNFHRASAQYDPITPLTHDVFNVAHTAYGLVTTGISHGRWSWEGTVFNGTLADDNSYDFDLAPMHSYATRATAELAEGTSAQFSFASLQPSPGGSAHGHGGGRMRAFSLSVERVAGEPGHNNALTLAWSAHRAGGVTSHAGMLEGQLTRARHTLFSRLELLERVEEEVIIIENPDGSHQHNVTPRSFWLGEFSSGYAFRLGGWLGLHSSLGARVSVNRIPSYIEPRYLSDMGLAFALFARVARAGTPAHQH
jgi:hypothetical protein